MALQKWNWTIIWALHSMRPVELLQRAVRLAPCWHLCLKKGYISDTLAWSNFANPPWRNDRMTSLMISRTLFKRHLSKTNRSIFLSGKKCYKQLSSTLILSKLLKAPSASPWTPSASSLCILVTLHWTSSNLLTSLLCWGGLNWT